MSTRYDLQEDLHELSEMAKRLQGYLRQDELYSSQGLLGTSIPALTVGNVLMRMRRLQVLRERLSQAGQATLDRAIANHNEARQDWMAHYNQKVLAELHSRLHSLHTFLDDWDEAFDRERMSYWAELTHRTIIEELSLIMRQDDLQDTGLSKAIDVLDQAMRERTTPAAFQWDPLLRVVYDENQFWWLYSTFVTQKVT